MTKPDFDDFETEFKSLLKARNASQNLRWVFRQNLALAHPPGSRAHKIYFQTFSPEIDRGKLAAFYREYADGLNFIGAEALVYEKQFTLCALLDDPWNLEEDAGDVFHSGKGYGFAVQDGYKHYQEIADKYQWWVKYLLQSRTLSGLDFVPKYRRFGQWRNPLLLLARDAERFPE